MSIDWSGLVEIIDQHQRFVLSSHVRPDADALGSELAFASLLRSRGKEVWIINPGATPAHLQFLDPEQQARAINEQPGLVQKIRECDVHVVLDTSAWGQLAEVGKELAKSPALKVVIDHHVSSDDLGAREFKDTLSPATGCLVFAFMEHVGYVPDRWEAECLYTAIATDTGWFRFPATTPETMRIAGQLMVSGAEPAKLFQLLYEQNSLARMHLSGVALQRAVTACSGKLAYSYVTQADLAATQANPADTESLVNECMRLKGVVAAFFLMEQPNRTFKASLRSREQFDVTPIAESFGGGGHRQASGAVIPGPLESALERLVALFSEHLCPDTIQPQA